MILNDNVFKCLICGSELKQMVKLTLWCNASEQTFNKTALRKKGIEISYVNRPEPSEWTCPEHGRLSHIWSKLDESK